MEVHRLFSESLHLRSSVAHLKTRFVQHSINKAVAQVCKTDYFAKQE